MDQRDAGRLLVFTATYNERDNVGVLLSGIWNAVPQAHVLVVDDNSPDGTGALLDAIATTEPRLFVIHRRGKLGLGTAHHLAMLFALHNGYDTLVTMDADLSHDPADIPRLVAKLASADFVTGSRYMQGGSCDFSGYRSFVSRAANAAARLLLRLPLHEFTTSFRAFRARRLADLDFVKMHNGGYSFFMETVFRLHQARFRLTEAPIHFRDRTAKLQNPSLRGRSRHAQARAPRRSAQFRSDDDPVAAGDGALHQLLLRSSLGSRLAAGQSNVQVHGVWLGSAVRTGA